MYPSFPRKRESQLSQNQSVSKNVFIANLILYGIFMKTIRLKTFCIGYLLTVSMAVRLLPLSAQNLVPNPSFETYLSCPSNNVFTASDWYNPNTATPDYFHPCGSGWTIPGAGVLFGPQNARTGLAFAGVGWYGLGGGWYDYIQVQLTTPMTAGESYAISMWVNLADGVRKASDDIGIYISTNPFKSTSTILPAIPTIIPTTPASFGVFTTLVPQIKTANGNFITDVSNWTLVSGTYLATGGEQAITIGCFEPWATTGTLTVNPTGNDRCYYYIEDVSVVKIIPQPIELLSFKAVIEGDEIRLVWATASEIHNDYFTIQRSKDRTIFENVGTMKAAGNSTRPSHYEFTDANPYLMTYYRLLQTDFDGVTTYSHIVATQRLFSSKKQFIYFYNLSNHTLKVQAQKPIEQIEIHSMEGKNICSTEIKDKATECFIQLPDFSNGVYLVTVRGVEGGARQKIVIGK